MDATDKYKYTVALPAPSLCAQFNNLEDINILLTAIKNIGFDDVFEVSAAAEIVSEESRKYIASHKDQWPLISTACPTVVRLVQVRFPNLCDKLLPLITPAELAGELDISISYLYELMKGTRKNEDQKAKIRQVLGIPDIDSDG